MAKPMKAVAKAIKAFPAPARATQKVGPMSKPVPKGTNMSKPAPKPAAKPFVPYYGGKGGKMSSGAGWGGEKPGSIGKKKK